MAPEDREREGDEWCVVKMEIANLESEIARLRADVERKDEALKRTLDIDEGQVRNFQRLWDALEIHHGEPIEKAVAEIERLKALGQPCKP